MRLYFSWEGWFDWQEIFELFFKPNIKDAEFEFGKIDEEKIKEILIERHNFSEERVQRQIDKLKDLKERAKQKGLDKWF